MPQSQLRRTDVGGRALAMMAIVSDGVNSPQSRAVWLAVSKPEQMYSKKHEKEAYLHWYWYCESERWSSGCNTTLGS